MYWTLKKGDLFTRVKGLLAAAGLLRIQAQ